MLQGTRVAVVIPAYQEEVLLGETIAGVPGFVDRIIVVDDGSEDHTFAVAQAAAADQARVIAIRLPVNLGVGGAIMEGYRVAMSGGAEVIAVMAGDNQMDPSELADVMMPVLSGRADYVKGNRDVHPARKDMPAMRRRGSAFLGRATAQVAGLPKLGDAQCGYTAIRSSFLRAMPLELIFPRYGYPNDLLLRLAEVGARIVEVPVRPVYGAEVSGLKIHRVILPISKILIRGAGRRVLASVFA